MGKLIIKGHKEFGKEIINIFKMLGGVSETIDCADSHKYYYIDNDYSKRWIDFLLFQHKNEYAKAVFNWSTDKISLIQKITVDKIKQFTEQETKKSKKSIDKYNTIAEKAMKYLSDEDILDIIEDVNVY